MRERRNNTSALVSVALLVALACGGRIYQPPAGDDGSGPTAGDSGAGNGRRDAGTGAEASDDAGGLDAAAMADSYQPSDDGGGGPPCTATPTAIAEHQSMPTGIAVDATSIFWTNGNQQGTGGSVMRAPLSGGAPTQVGQSANPGAIAVDTTMVYWTDLSEGTIRGVFKDGTGPTVLASGSLAPVSIAVDSPYVYWTNIMADATVGSVTRLDAMGGMMMALAGGGGALDLAIDSTSVYFIVGGNPTAVQKVPLAGGGVVTLAASTSARGIFVDATSVYWTDDVAGTVSSVPIDGGAVTQIASQQATPLDVVVDAFNAYWRNSDSVMKAPTGGGAPVVLAKQSINTPTYAKGIAVDDSCVYWSDGAPDGHVMEVAK